MSGPPCGRLTKWSQSCGPQRDPEVVVWPSGFWEAWRAEANKNTPRQEENALCWHCRLRQQGQKNSSFLKMCVLLASVPQASKKHLAKKELRDPFEDHKNET